MISFYIWKRVSEKLNTKVTYQDSIDFENRIAKENGYNFDHLDLSGLDKPYKTIKTRFGDLNLFKHGNSKKVVVYCHGVLSNNRNAIKLLDYFIPRGYSVIAYDNFGWGESEKFGKCTLGVKEADLLKDVIDAVKTNLNPKELVVYGESMGGGTVYNYLHKYSNQGVDKFIVDAGYNSFFENIVNDSFPMFWYFMYLSYLFLPLFCLASKWPIKRFNRLEDFEKWDNVLHIHSKQDELVSYRHAKTFIEHLKNTHIYEQPTVHCLGIYYARDEHYKVLDSWLNVQRIEPKEVKPMETKTMKSPAKKAPVKKTPAKKAPVKKTQSKENKPMEVKPMEVQTIKTEPKEVKQETPIEPKE
ncbi:alpha/beta fold hydrolase [Mycoplasma putrefaciens]|uniref:Serine aminopeptidase S33 domain-containing protein n=1 Tax=Mycoplasma putrefaciens (strain ATCC 15718 / NCTC 10155 / C30 KS-1 / KS-1) TaxID=743965 RepID=A0A7U3ZRZ1_MYCPK|nr:alpha/beta fold hydrolase [Mycoplasma putrefaciens]AEM68432.1 uncharacterized protein MPUT_0024 [Mycoplasma putrefaciens KS1]